MKLSKGIVFAVSSSWQCSVARRVPEKIDTAAMSQRALAGLAEFALF